jgi:uroporphyrinogen-III decarboxylase
MSLINSLDMAGLLIEESKKHFVLDPVEIRKMLRPQVCLFGNVDSTLLKHGTPDQIRAEVSRQLRAAEIGPFVLANGSPIVCGTPVENLQAYLSCRPAPPPSTAADLNP